MSRKSHGFTEQRFAWADFAKGLTIILVAMMHSTLGVELAAGDTAIMGWIVDFARAFRMPLFFAIAGLFAASALKRSWLSFSNAKLVHFAYFYVLWSVLQIGARLALAGHGQHDITWTQFLLIPIEPFGTIWFIFVLPLFLLVARLSRSVPPILVFSASVLLSLLQTRTGWIAPDAFSKYLVFFLGGLYGAPWLTALADWARGRILAVLALFALFGCANLQVMSWGLIESPGFALILGLAGTVALVSLSGLAGHHRLAAPVRYCGRNSLVIYVAFSFPMVAARAIGTKSGLMVDPDLMAVFVTAVAVSGTLAMAWAARKTPLVFLFDRPAAIALARSEPTGPLRLIRTRLAGG